MASYADGGGRRGASRIPVLGRERVARYVRAFADRFWTGVDVAWTSANGQPAALLSRQGTVFAVLAVTASPEGIDQLLWMLNPDKFRGVPAPA